METRKFCNWRTDDPVTLKSESNILRHSACITFEHCRLLPCRLLTCRILTCRFLSCLEVSAHILATATCVIVKKPRSLCALQRRHVEFFTSFFSSHVSFLFGAGSSVSLSCRSSAATAMHGPFSQYHRPSIIQGLFEYRALSPLYCWPRWPQLGF
jgi:hypothetical protein